MMRDMGCVILVATPIQAIAVAQSPCVPSVLSIASLGARSDPR